MKKFDQHIKEKLSQSQLPPIDAWKNIQEKLDEKEKKRRIFPIFYWIGSSAACIIAGVGIYYLYLNNSFKSDYNPINEVVRKENISSLESLSSIKKVKKQDYTQNKTNNNQHTNNTELKKYFNPNFIESDALSKKQSGKQYEILTQDFSSNNSATNELSIQENNFFSQKNDIKDQEFITKNEDDKPLELVLEEEKNRKGEEIEIKQKSPILAISSYINPTLMLESKSILDNEFNDYNIKNNTTIAYGAKISVRINNKLSIRSGIAKVELEQNTDNVNSSINAGVYSSISLPPNSNNIRYNSNIKVVTEVANQNSTIDILTTQNNMEQNIHYIEVPLEVEYKLASFNKFNLLATAGGSYYLVTKNSITLTDVNSRNQYTLGKANNLNNMSYSANAGVKLEYNLSHKSSINLEPNYKYMLNPLRNVDARNPSLLGINLGFSIKF